MIIINIYVPKILYVIVNNEGANDVWIKISVINIHVLQFVVFEKVLEEAVTILLVCIINTVNPTKIIQGSDVIATVGIKATE